MRYVIALGGNALEKLDEVEELANDLEPIAAFYKQGNEIALTHGNGPQVGELAGTKKGILAEMTAKTQLMIGVRIRAALAVAIGGERQKALNRIEVLQTRTVVDSADPAFKNPTKPVGRFMGLKEAEALQKNGFAVKKLVNGYRRVVPSPRPKEILELGHIRKTLGKGLIAISCGGGGIPVAYSGKRLYLVDAVIDKDRTAALLAERLGADKLIILTDVDGAYLNYKKRNGRMLGCVSVKEMERYLKEGQFEEGSMKPKVEACVDFARATGREGIIGNIGSLKAHANFERATVVTP